MTSGPKTTTKYEDRFRQGRTLTCTYIGMYRHNSRRTLRAPPSGLNQTSAQGDSVQAMHTVQSDLARYSTMAANYFWTTYSTLNGSYVAIFTVVLIVMLSFIIPDFSQKLHRTHELKAMKKVLMKMSGEVSRAEVACLAVADEIRCLHCSMQDGGVTETLKNHKSVCQSGEMQVTQSEPVHLHNKMSLFQRFFLPRKNVSLKEVTIMSYLYTDSFDGGAEHMQTNNANSLSEKTPAKDLNK